ncbi:MAG: Phosphoribosylformylglycinamidine synthase 1 [Candidatus Roizmanbacteria bacterium GW2011_GWA2_33_33]|uniref:Phosphoribosylformylglycinamidine synthase 1 n=2 Tax=Candidatus Roizmaniibacteriota TaxID=1752723 RepID=A0A0G0BDF6_9BACT|nr:MAG: Phosphoribosylformylglycinamidine synthase 1 [Candidatus Roizmanbacteria bacterium GW2011_GWA2_33_33]KKP61591.1 MAG: Phosphoribosylformylglycinamidine synthase 1 [Candidatus Roizmanbacteria bacterium GW2011_GWC2_34_23]
MKKPKVLILSGYGLNCEDETKYAFELAGGLGKIIHINDLIKNKNQLNDFQIMAIPGGFAYGDDTGSGNAYSLKLKNHLWENLLKFVIKDRLVIGICNGFQILVNLGLVPALNRKYGERQVALLPNESTRYTTGWFDLKITNDTPWLTGIKKISLPIAHGEGKFFASKEVLSQINKKNLVVIKYINNPTGTLENIAGITDESKRIFGLMPHPERAMFFTQLPNWPYLKEKYLRERKKLPEFGPGLQIFKNGVNYFK